MINKFFLPNTGFWKNLSHLLYDFSYPILDLYSLRFCIYIIYKKGIIYTELHPHSVTNTPTEPCPKTSVCGAQATTIPLSLVLSRNRLGRRSFRCSLRDQRKGKPLASNAYATATISCGGGVTTVPKLTYATNPPFFFY